jgi:signal transduction histidine kinase
VQQRSRLIAAIVLVALAALGVFYYATTSVINRAFDTIENRDVNQNTARGAEAITTFVNSLTFKVSDWSDWDDTYAFVENHNQAYITSNLLPSALSLIGIHVMLFYNQQQKLVFSESIDPTTSQAVPTSSALLAQFAPGSKLLSTSVTSESQGLLALPSGVIQFVSEPILTSDSSGPIHGTLVFGTWLTPAEITQFGAQTQQNVNYYNLASTSIPPAVKSSLGAKPTVGEKNIVRVSSKQIVGYQVIPDAYGNPGLVVQVTQARDIHDVATSALSRFLWLVLLDSGAAIIVVLILAEMIRRRDRTIALKNEFFSIASHELRTPLTVIRDYAQLMKFTFSKQVNDPKFDHMADNIDSTGAQLIGLVNVFLDAARMEQGKIPFEVKPFALGPVMVALQPEVTATAHKKNVTFTVECPPDLPQAMGDEARVRQAILNLIGNAMKFTDTGGITLKAEAKGKMVMVYVSDTGRGMDEAAQKVLFQRFSQVKTGDAKLGSGLGLFISKKLIEQMGGSIQVDSSAPGIGTSISFSLPIAPPQTMAAMEASASPAPAQGSVTVLPPESGHTPATQPPAPSTPVQGSVAVLPPEGGQTPPPTQPQTTPTPPANPGPPGPS